MTQPRPLDVAVLVSGRGSNLQSLIDACATPDFPARIVCVISNKADAYGLERARRAGIPAHVVDHRAHSGRPAFEAALEDVLRPYEPGLICLAGFMRVLTADFADRWRDRMINIHPSLLPAFRGLHTHEQVIEAGVKISGCTVHYVRPEMDDGPIIIQAATPVEPHDTAETLAARVLKLEHMIYPEALRLIAMGQVRVAGHKAEMPGAPPNPGTLINPPLASLD